MLRCHRQGLTAAIWMSDSKRCSNLKRKQRLHPQAETSGHVCQGRVLLALWRCSQQQQLGRFTTTTLQPLLWNKQCAKAFCSSSSSCPHLPPHHPAVTPKRRRHCVMKYQYYSQIHNKNCSDQKVIQLRRPHFEINKNK